MVRTLALLLLLAGSCAGGASVSITSPENGASVESPFEVSMEADGFTIEPAGEVREGTGHFHLMVDAGCVAPGDEIPEDASHLHFGDGATEADLDLPAGEHTLCLQAGDGAHTALDLTDQITISVTGPGGGATEEGEEEGEEEGGVEEWEGAYVGAAVVRGEAPGSCEYEVEGTYVITVDANGRATMEVAASGEGFCVGKRVPRFTDDLVAVGERTPSGFRFENWVLLGAGVIETITIAVTGEEGVGDYTGPAGVGGASNALLDFNVRCVSC